MKFRLVKQVVVHNAEIYWKTVGLFCEALSVRLISVHPVVACCHVSLDPWGCRQEYTNLYAQANVYYSPPGQAATVSAHQDAQSVFIVQIEGRKTWCGPLHRPRVRCTAP